MSGDHLEGTFSTGVERERRIVQYTGKKFYTVHIVCKQSFRWMFCLLKFAVRANRCQRLSPCLVYWCEELNRGLSFFHSVLCRLCRFRVRKTRVLVGLLCQVLTTVWQVCYSQGTLHNFDCLQFIRSLTRFSMEMHEARGFSPTSPHALASNVQLSASRRWEGEIVSIQ